nr:MAG TPA: hypothetical protein [Herelleviridae sp.]
MNKVILFDHLALDSSVRELPLSPPLRVQRTI